MTGYRHLPYLLDAHYTNKSTLISVFDYISPIPTNELWYITFLEKKCSTHLWLKKCYIL